MSPNGTINEYLHCIITYTFPSCYIFPRMYKWLCNFKMIIKASKYSNSVVRNKHTYEIPNKDYNKHCYLSSFFLIRIKRNQGCRAQSKNPFLNTETFCVWNCLRVTPCVVTLFIHSLNITRISFPSRWIQSRQPLRKPKWDKVILTKTFPNFKVFSLGFLFWETFFINK